jgi:hypothetical protein
MLERPNMIAPMTGIGMGMEEGGWCITFLNPKNSGFLPRCAVRPHEWPVVGDPLPILASQGLP